MKPLTQKDTNPFPNSDSNKRYYTYDYYFVNDRPLDETEESVRELFFNILNK